MKNIFILSEDKVFKKSLTTFILNEGGVDKVKYVTASNRNNAIYELSQKEFNSVIIDCSLVKNDLNLILKYLSTNDYYFCHIFFISSDFTVFKEILDHINFPHLHLISEPFNTEELCKKILISLFPIDTGTVDQNIKINLDFLKVFIDSTKKVFLDFCSLTKIQHQKPYLKSTENSNSYAVLGSIPLSSEIFEGVFYIGFTKEVYLTLINKVLLIEAREINDEIMDFAAELVNMIYGQAKVTLNNSGHNFLKVIPSFESYPEFIPSKHHTVVVPIQTDIGNIFIEVKVVKVKGMTL